MESQYNMTYKEALEWIKVYSEEPNNLPPELKELFYLCEKLIQEKIDWIEKTEKINERKGKHEKL